MSGPGWRRVRATQIPDARLTPDGLVLLVHYNGGAQDVVDQTEVALRWVDDAPALTARVALDAVVDLDVIPRTMDPPFLIPAGAVDHPEQVRVPLELPEGTRIWSVFPHMHYAGVSQRVWVDHAAHGGEDACRVEVGRWDFDWQRAYAYDAPVAELPEVHAGDELVIDCTYDSHVDNPSIGALLEGVGADEPFDLTNGNASTNEMCVALVGLVMPAEG
jgi:hypothetical protein